MNRVDETVVREAFGQGGDGPADLLDSFAEVFPAVPSNEDHGHLRPVDPNEETQLLVDASAQRRIPSLSGHLYAQGVDNGVPCHRDGPLRNGLAEQGRTSRLS